MIKLTQDKTVLEQNLYRIEESLLLVDNYVRAAIMNLNQSYNALWNLPDDELLELLNFLGLAKSTEIFETHYKHAVGLNEIMDARGIIGDRAVCVMGRSLGVNELGEFIIAPVIVPEPPVETEVPVEPEIPA